MKTLEETVFKEAKLLLSITLGITLMGGGYSMVSKPLNQC